MYIKKLNLINFRNYLNQELEFSKNINIIYGNNAQGKTNIIESIFLCALGKSYRSKKDKELINFEKDKAIVDINYYREDREGNIKAEISDNKTFYINDIKQKKISEIIGKINIVIFTPDDINIVKDGPSQRRKFLDVMISGIKPNYLYLLTKYLKVLEQRNQYLKQIKFENKPESMLDIWDEQLAELDEKIYEYRKYFVSKINEKIKDIHKRITECGKNNSFEEILINYISTGESKDNYLNNLIKSRKSDIYKGSTSIGIHRDDFNIIIDGKNVSIYGSQGQQRTAILSLKMSELEIVYDEIGEKPILLLDDFMSELDESRRNSLLKNVVDNQIIITCTDKLNIDADVVYNVENGIAYKEE